MYKNLTKYMLACAALLGASSQGATLLVSAHENVDGTYSYFQNFNHANPAEFSLAALNGWYCSDPAGPKASSGNVFSGGIYHFGTSISSSDRALGSIASSAIAAEVYGLVVSNDSTKTLQVSSLAYTMEQWRCGFSTPNTLRLEYAVGAGLDFSSDKSNFSLLESATLSSLVHDPVGALNGDLAQNRTRLELGLQQIYLQPGQNLVLRWLDANETGNDQGLAIDDFSFSLIEAQASLPEPASAMLLLPALASVLLKRRRHTGKVHGPSMS